MGDLMAIANEHSSGEEAWIAKKMTWSAFASPGDPGTYGVKDEYDCPRCNNNRNRNKRRNPDPNIDLDHVNTEFGDNTRAAAAKARRIAHGRARTSPTQQTRASTKS